MKKSRNMLRTNRHKHRSNNRHRVLKKNIASIIHGRQRIFRSLIQLESEPIEVVSNDNAPE